MNVLPDDFKKSHELCFLIHDIMVQIIKSGEKQHVFTVTLDIDEEEKLSINDEDNILYWLQSRDRLDDKHLIIRSAVLPRILSDMMHCVYESLSASSKGKTSVAYMLIRKPIQESLYVLESMILNEEQFVNDLENDPLKLRPKNGGGIEGHTKRVSNVLDILDVGGVFDPGYIAQLRYDKEKYDSFDGICNKAIHLFTEHKAIRTENFNINFIISGAQQLSSQWQYFYSRLPYLLLYIYFIVEYILQKIALTPEIYLADMMRRISASYIMASTEISEKYFAEENKRLVTLLRAWLIEHCINNGYSKPNFEDLIIMSKNGSFPHESEESIKSRLTTYEDVTYPP